MKIQFCHWGMAPVRRLFMPHKWTKPPALMGESLPRALSIKTIEGCWFCQERFVEDRYSHRADARNALGLKETGSETFGRFSRSTSTLTFPGVRSNFTKRSSSSISSCLATMDSSSSSFQLPFEYRQAVSRLLVGKSLRISSVAP